MEISVNLAVREEQLRRGIRPVNTDSHLDQLHLVAQDEKGKRRREWRKKMMSEGTCDESLMSLDI